MRASAERSRTSTVAPPPARTASSDWQRASFAKNGDTTQGQPVTSRATRSSTGTVPFSRR